ncbi:MAG: 50S ribosomal protein L11 methyltransferase, partial [Fulvivirga sp.]|uniref:50S ribosomal protein L11 methyltransferase n=1 Tax=Fulvivirga sp. TaxID=1931237 RepID=UPI0032ECC55B
PEPGFKYDLVINPRMSFGTGHHATTYLMLKHQLETDHKGKRVLDAGCGTAILAVMAEKLGATEVLAYDNNSWSTENAPENIELNNCKNVEIQEGTIDTIKIEGEYDLILANINKNVLLDEMDKYYDRLSSGGKIIFSGFYTPDNEDITKRATDLGLKFVKGSDRKDWSSLIFQKN